MKLKLDDVINCLDITNSKVKYYYNPNNNEFFPSDIGDFKDINEDQLDDLFENSIMLPSSYEINEYQMMIDFIDTIENDIINKQLLIAVNGKGAFRRFKDTCINYDIINDWYNFRNEKYKEIAIDWCNKNNIEFM